MGNIHKLTKDGVTLFPATTTDAVVHPQVRASLSNLINEYNISSLYPTLGKGNSDIYTLQDAINLLSTKLDENQKVGGIKIIFKDENSNYQEWRYLGTDIFNNASQWSREDSWYVDYSEINDLQNEEFSGDILRKTEQSLSTVEKDQVKKNLGIEIKAEKITWSNTSNLNLYTTTGIYTIDGYKTVPSDNLPIVDFGPDVRFTAFMIVNNNPKVTGQTITITDSKTNLTKSYTRNYDIINDVWSDWQNNEGIIELGNITVDTLDSLTAEGMYEGIIEDFDLLFPGINKSNFSLIVKNTEIKCTQLLYLGQGILIVRSKVNNTDLWTSFSEFITKEMLEDIYGVRIQTLESKVKILEEKLESINEIDNNFCVGAWDPNSLSPESLYTEGNLDFCDEWNIYLLDTTDNRKETTTPVGKLMRNNLLRFEDGSWAPVVGITEERRAECDGELYIKNSNNDLVKYCLPGEFNPSQFYEDYGMYTKLYNSDGSEVNILRPWETTETKYTIGVGRSKSIYLLDNIKGNSGKVWKGIFSNPTIWDGIDVSEYELKPTAFSPGGCAIINEDGKIKLRNFFYLYSGYSNSNGYEGQGGNDILKNIDRTFPTSQINQINTMTYARNNNNSSTSPVPFAEGGYHTVNSYLTSYEVLYGTKYLHADNKFTNGICNSTCNSESTWLINGGLRYREKGETDWDWVYKSWGANTNYYYMSTSSSLTMMTASNLVNTGSPKEQCMESQIVASFAQELGIPENTEFNVYGDTYWYVNVPGAIKLEEGRMNVIVYKKTKTQEAQVLNSTGNPITIELEMVLRVGLVNGVNLGGDYTYYCGGGLELVGTNDPNVNIDYTANKGGFPVKIYQELDQTNWLWENASIKNDYGIFNFENNYKLLKETTNIPGENYIKSRHSYTPYSSEKGGSSSTGECSYCWSGNNWSYSQGVLGQRARIGVRLRSFAVNVSAGFRSCLSYYSASATSSYSSACAQARISETL